MATNSNLLTAEDPPRTLGSQVNAFLAAALLAERFPQFDGAYVSFSKHYPDQVVVQVDSLSALEAWREALGVDPAEVQSLRIGSDTELTFDVSVHRATVRVYVIEQIAAVVAAVAA